MEKHQAWILALTGLTLFALTGCSVDSAQQEKLDIANYSAVAAKIDAANMRITLPLAPYYVDEDEDVIIQTANAALLAPCMRAKGQELDVSEAIPKPMPEDRRYGIWNMSNAEKYGYELPPDPTHLSGVAQEAAAGVPVSPPPVSTKPREYGLAYTLCNKELAGTMLNDFTPTQVGSESEASRGIAAAATQASGTDEWKAVRSEWVTCLSAQGISMPQGNPDSWIPEVSKTDKQSQIKTALADVNCKNKAGYVKRLADIEAKYQAAYIGQHESALNKLKAEKDAAIGKAKQIIAGVK